mgnify:CR=1 FL=1
MTVAELRDSMSNDEYLWWVAFNNWRAVKQERARNADG